MLPFVKLSCLPPLHSKYSLLEIFCQCLPLQFNNSTVYDIIDVPWPFEISNFGVFDSNEQVVICGSANINDPSMLGDRLEPKNTRLKEKSGKCEFYQRDSEVCLHLADCAFTPGRMNGKDAQCGRCKKLFIFLAKINVSRLIHNYYAYVCLSPLI